MTSSVTQRDGGTGRGHAGKPHLAAPRRPGTHWRAPPRRSGGLTARRSLARWMIPGWHPSACPDQPGSPGIRSAADHPGAVLELLQHRGVPAGAPAHPCAVTHDQPYRGGATGPVRHARRTGMPAPRQSRKTLSAADEDERASGLIAWAGKCVASAAGVCLSDGHGRIR